MASASTIPKTMLDIQIEKTGGVEVLQYKSDIPVPVPGEGEVLVKIECSGVNFIDTYYRTGLYPTPLPTCLGREGAGTIVAIGPPSKTHDKTTPLALADRVAFLCNNGSYAEYAIAKVLHTHKIPSHVSSQRACASMIQGLTALTLVTETAPARAGDVVLVHAAAGGMGGWLCRILKKRGVHVIATAGDERKRGIAIASGAEVAVGYGEEEVLKEVRERTPGGDGVAAVYDGVGKSTFETSLKACARKATLASFGNASGPVAPFTISRLAPKCIRLCRPTLFPYIATREEFEGYATELFDLLEDPAFDVPVHKIYPLKDAAQAHSDIEGRGTVGKLLIEI